MARTVFITGSTSGIGLALARQYHAQGWRVITHGRQNNAPLPLGTDHLCLDLNDDAAGQTVLTELQRLGVESLDLLINNAAMAYYGHTAEEPWESVHQQVCVNFMAPLDVTWHLFPLLRAASGTVVFVSSVASALPTPQYAVYSATKAAMDGFVRSFRQETAGTGITVLCVHPAGTTTAMHARAGFPAEALRKMKFAPAEVVAAKIIQKIESGRNGALSTGMKLATLVCRKFSPVVDRLIALGKRTPYNGTAAAADRGTLITGTGSGIGAALKAACPQALGVDLLAAEGTLAVDLTDETALKSLAQNIEPVGLAIWNAGINATGRFWEIPWSKHAQVIKLNFLAPLLLSRTVLAKHPTATQVFISSLSHQLSYPGASSYAGTKSGLAHYARSLRSGGFAALTVFPGPTDTPHAALHSPPDAKAKPNSRMSPQQLAQHILHAVAAKKAVLVPGLGNKTFALLGHWMPQVAEFAMRKVLWQKMPPGHITG